MAPHSDDPQLEMIEASKFIASRADKTAILAPGYDPVYETATLLDQSNSNSISISTIIAAKLGFRVESFEASEPFVV